MKHITALLMISAFAFSNCKAMKPATVIIIALSGNKQATTITVHKGDTLLVRLPMASGTGYIWEVVPKPNLCKQGQTSYGHIKKRMPGAPQIEVINLTATALGTEDIYFIYHRPFEKSNPPAKTKTLHLIVR